MKKRLLLLLPLVAVTLAGCSFLKRLFFGDETTSQPIHYVYPDPVVQPDIPGRSIYKSFSYNLKDVLNTTGQVSLPSTGEQKILIIPVQLTGSSLTWTSVEKEEIRKCFFGATVETGWESVSSYYHKSSYGKFSLTGELTNTFVSSYTKAQLQAEAHPDRKIVEEFEKSSLYNELRKKYDTNSDGFIDSCAFIYREKIQVTSNDMRWWAFVYTNDSAPSVDKPTVNQYMWASYYFSQKASSDNPHGGAYNLDAHTYIHEFGHILGLDDYYSYYDNNAYDPSGGQEMHSQNIGDENIYSKLVLGWIEPYYVKTDSSVTTTLYASSYSGASNAIIINDNWNENPMDEYLIIEYYSPTVLNEKDSQQAYATNAQMFSTSGFRVYHVDSRLVAYTKTGNPAYEKRLDELDPNYYNFIGASNTPSSPYSRLNSVYEIQNFKLLHMIQAGGVNTFQFGAKATNADLFKAGSSFVASSNFFAKGTKFNAGNEVGYRISFDQCDEENQTGTVTITKI